ERQFTDYNDLIASDVDCVVVCNTTSYHADPAIAAARAGKHVLIEKPMCTTVAEAERIASAVAESGVVAMVGYMKQHDPAYLHARELVESMQDIRLVKVEHLHPDNSLHLKRFALHRPTDLDPSIREAMTRDERRLTAEALGVDPDRLAPDAHKAFFWVLNSMIHDISNLSGLFGPPKRVVSSTMWADGNCITCTLEYATSFRAIATWVDLPDLQTFRETVEVYGSEERVIVSFPTGFSIGLPTEVDHHGMDADGKPWVQRRSWQENPFRLELLQFHRAITTGAPVLTPVETAVHDIRLAGDIVKAAMRTEGFRHAD
ncbi:MAG: Gfo/Idh/MocA family oxidoreductase, partial [Chloroflexota bacterium]|nr:Gfo/Idh/MocA family oxidoreductase [Chloroflexota bacterium]